MLTGVAGSLRLRSGLDSKVLVVLSTPLYSGQSGLQLPGVTELAPPPDTETAVTVWLAACAAWAAKLGRLGNV